MIMYREISKINDKVERLKKHRNPQGFSNGRFPTYNDSYPCLTEFSTRFWQHTWHEDRGMNFYRFGDIWVSEQLFISTTLAKSVGKILLDLEFYSYIESINIRFDSISSDTLYIDKNGANYLTVEFEDKDLINLDFNNIFMLNDYLTVYFESNQSAITQIKYRIIG